MPGKQAGAVRAFPQPGCGERLSWGPADPAAGVSRSRAKGQAWAMHRLVSGPMELGPHEQAEAPPEQPPVAAPAQEPASAGPRGASARCSPGSGRAVRCRDPRRPGASERGMSRRLPGQPGAPRRDLPGWGGAGRGGR